MYHERLAGAAIGLVIGIGVAKVKGEMIVTVRIHPIRRHYVKAFRALQVPFLLFWPQLACGCADRIDAKEAERLARLHPDLDLLGGFKDAQEDGRAIVQPSSALSR